MWLLLYFAEVESCCLLICHQSTFQCICGVVCRFLFSHPKLSRLTRMFGNYIFVLQFLHHPLQIDVGSLPHHVFALSRAIVFTPYYVRFDLSARPHRAFVN